MEFVTRDSEGKAPVADPGAVQPDNSQQTQAPTGAREGESVKPYRTDPLKLAARLDRYAGRIYEDLAQSDLWADLICARDFIKDALAQAPSLNTGGDREAIARIVGPEAFKAFDVGSDDTMELSDAEETALAKADDIITYLAALAPLPSGWRTISSAPRDGTVILSWNLGDYVLIRWDRSDNAWEGVCDGAGVVEHMGDFGIAYKLFYPEVWQPLPAPPNPPVGGSCSQDEAE